VYAARLDRVDVFKKPPKDVRAAKAGNTRLMPVAQADSSLFTQGFEVPDINTLMMSVKAVTTLLYDDVASRDKSRSLLRWISNEVTDQDSWVSLSNPAALFEIAIGISAGHVGEDAKAAKSLARVSKRGLGIVLVLLKTASQQ
jgi:hypothetical protein